MGMLAGGGLASGGKGGKGVKGGREGKEGKEKEKDVQFDEALLPRVKRVFDWEHTSVEGWHELVEELEVLMCEMSGAAEYHVMKTNPF